MKGKIVRYFPDKGFGFIKQDEKPYTQYFFHNSGFVTPANIKSGMDVEFEPHSDAPKGPRAELITLA